MFGGLHMKRGDKVYFQAPGFRSGFHLVKDVRDDMNPPACKINHSGSKDIWVRQSECVLAEIKSAQEEAERLEEAKTKYADIINAWNDGARTLKEIAAYLHVANTGLWPRVDAAKRKGLIKE